MVDETSRLDVEVDGTGAAQDVDKITRAFNKLEASVQRTASAFSRLGRGSAGAFRTMRSAGSKAFGALSKGINIVKRLGSTFLRAFRSMFKIALIAAGVFTVFAKSIADAGNKMNKFVNTLVILKGNTADAVKELQILFNLSNKLGTSFVAAATPFTKFAAAAAGTLSDQSIRDVFEAFATVGVALQLTQSEVTGVFLALQQIASKGVVSMEELRLQLAERVPGAMRLAAISMGMSMREFEEAVRFRTINAGEFLEKFSAKLKETFGLAAELASQRLFADIQRLGNEFVRFRQEIFQSGFEEGLQELVKSASNFLAGNPELAQALGGFSKRIFTDVARFLDSLTSDKIVGIINQLIGVFEILINTINTLAFHVKRLFDDDFDKAVTNIEQRSRSLDTMIRERNAMADMLATGQTVIGFGARLEDMEFGPASEAQLENARNNIDDLEENIFILRNTLQGTIGDVRDLGVEIANLPDSLFGNLPQGGLGVGPPVIELPKITVQDTVEGGLILSKQPQISGIPPAVLDALEQAERLATIQMPEFFDKILSGEIRAGMDDLARVTFDLNVLNEFQRLALENIIDAEAELNDLRLVSDADADATALNDATRKLVKSNEDFLAVEKERLALKKEQLKLMDEEARKLEQVKTFQQTLEETFTSVQDAVINSIKKIEDTFVELVVKGEASFSDLANSIIADLARIAIQAFLTRFILGPLLGAASTALGNVLGGTLATPPTGSGPSAHTGGIIGSDRLQQRSAFDNLRNNERPIIVQTGEGVFTREQMRAMAPVSDMVNSLSRLSSRSLPRMSEQRPIVNVTLPETKIEVINNTGEEVQVEQTRGTAGNELIQLIIGTVNSDIAGDGNITRTLRNKFGLTNTTGLR